MFSHVETSLHLGLDVRSPEPILGNLPFASSDSLPGQDPPQWRLHCLTQLARPLRTLRTVLSSVPCALLRCSDGFMHHIKRVVSLSRNDALGFVEQYFSPSWGSYLFGPEVRFYSLLW